MIRLNKAKTYWVLLQNPFVHLQKLFSIGLGEIDRQRSRDLKASLLYLEYNSASHASRHNMRPDDTACDIVVQRRVCASLLLQQVRVYSV